MNSSQLKNLCEKAARTVTCFVVTVRLAAPITKQFDGEVYNTAGGFIVNIRPELSDENFIYVLCHELGHIRAGHTSDIDSNLPPGALRLTPIGEISRQLKPETRTRENAADIIADELLDFVEENYRHFQGDTKLERQLKALCGYISPELRLRAARLGMNAGKQQATKR